MQAGCDIATNATIKHALALDTLPPPSLVLQFLILFARQRAKAIPNTIIWKIPRAQKN
jgi:hypothetical protein